MQSTNDGSGNDSEADVESEMCDYFEGDQLNFGTAETVLDFERSTESDDNHSNPGDYLIPVTSAELSRNDNELC